MKGGHMTADQILKTFKLSSETSTVRAVQIVREHLDNQPNPLKFANNILRQVEVPFIGNQKKAYLYVMTVVEQAMQNRVNIEEIMTRANQRIEHITNIIGPGAFYVEEEFTNEKEATVTRGKLGSKSARVRELYQELNGKITEAELIGKIQEELEVTKNNAFTYLYNLKKKLNKK